MRTLPWTCVWRRNPGTSGAWDGMGQPRCLLQAPSSSSALGDPHTVPSQAGLCSQGGRVGRRVASLSMKKGSQLCPRLADPRPLLSQACLGDGWLASSQQSVTQEEAALGPQTVINANSRLPEPGWPDLNLPGPFSLGLRLPNLGGRSHDTLMARGAGNEVPVGPKDTNRPAQSLGGPRAWTH